MTGREQDSRLLFTKDDVSLLSMPVIAHEIHCTKQIVLFVFTCIVVVLNCFVMCVCVCVCMYVCMYGFRNVCVLEIHGLSGKFPNVQNSQPLRRSSGARQVVLSNNEFDELGRENHIAPSCLVIVLCLIMWSHVWRAWRFSRDNKMCFSQKKNVWNSVWILENLLWDIWNDEDSIKGRSHVQDSNVRVMQTFQKGPNFGWRDLVQNSGSNMAASEIFIRDRGISVRVMSDVTEVT